MLALLFGLFFEPEVEGDMFLRNDCSISSDFMALLPERHDFSFFSSIFMRTEPGLSLKGRKN
jgi:hypothetical protein